VLKGAVTLGVPDDYATLIPRVLRPFSATHPMVEITVVCEPSIVLVECLRAGKVDIALVTMHPDLGYAPIRVVRRERTYWVGSERHQPELGETVRLALATPESCEIAKMATSILGETGRAAQLVFSSQNAAAIAEAVLAGLAVSALPQSALRPGMRVLGEAEGFPRLPDCEIAMAIRPGEVPGIVTALADYIVEGVGDDAVSLAA